MNVKYISKVFRLLEEDYKKHHAPVVSLVAQTTKDPFKVLVCAMLSTRTKDEITAIVCQRLFEKIKSLKDLHNISEQELQDLIYGVGFYKTKAGNLKTMAKTINEKFGGIIPDTKEELMSLKGVGLKVANLVLAESFDKKAICVDTHVHRITNRWCIIKTKNPDQTEKSLREILPKKYWIDINKYLVSLGQRICKPQKPLCNVCPIEPYCGKCL